MAARGAREGHWLKQLWALFVCYLVATASQQFVYNNKIDGRCASLICFALFDQIKIQISGPALALPDVAWPAAPRAARPSGRFAEGILVATRDNACLTRLSQRARLKIGTVASLTHHTERPASSPNQVLTHAAREGLWLEQPRQGARSASHRVMQI